MKLTPQQKDFLEKIKSDKERENQKARFIRENKENKNPLN